MKKASKILLRLALAGLIIFIFVFLFCNIWVVQSTKDKLFTRAEDLPENDVALLLGTSKYSRQGKPNLFFKYRIEAAAQLFFAKKIKHILVSGDNSLSYYNEPQDMKKALIALGVPDSLITMDYAGFRTFDSVVRCKKVFNQNKVIIITQEFHAYRALFISNYYDMEAVGFAADKVNRKYAILTIFRESFARCRAVLDLYVFNESPKFLGKKVGIKI